MSVGPTGYVVHDTHPYWMPPDALGLPGTLCLYCDRVRIVAGRYQAEHERQFGRALGAVREIDKVDAGDAPASASSSPPTGPLPPAVPATQAIDHGATRGAQRAVLAHSGARTPHQDPQRSLPP